jgi:hypothetical protein
MGRQMLPNISFRASSSSFKPEALSILLMTMSRGRLRSSSALHHALGDGFDAGGSVNDDDDGLNSGKTLMDLPMKSGAPGVSMMFRCAPS